MLAPIDPLSLPRRVLVTGGGGGIGKATVGFLRAQGVDVIATDLSIDALDSAGRDGATIVAGDITREDDRGRILETAGALDGLVNAAGIMRVTALDELSDEDWEPILDVNLKAPFYLARAAASQMSRGASIVNISSLAARHPSNVEVLAYAASKTALLTVTRGLAHAFGPRGIRVNAILPGIIETPMQDAVLEQLSSIRGLTRTELEEARRALVPLERRVGTAMECAQVITFLLSGAASYITGQAISVDGGVAMP